MFRIFSGKEMRHFEGKTRERERERYRKETRRSKTNDIANNNLTRLVCRTWNTALDDTFLFLFRIFLGNV